MYIDLMESDYFVKELYEVILNVLINWFKIINKLCVLFLFVVVFLWNEKFLLIIDIIIIENVGRLIFEVCNDIDGFEYYYKFCYGIIKWVNENGLEVGYIFKWWVDFLLDVYMIYLLIIGINVVMFLFVGLIMEEKVL